MMFYFSKIGVDSWNFLFVTEIDGEPEVVSLATGSKCIGKGKRQPDGMSCHNFVSIIEIILDHSIVQWLHIL